LFPLLLAATAQVPFARAIGTSYSSRHLNDVILRSHLMLMNQGVHVPVSITLLMIERRECKILLVMMMMIVICDYVTAN